MLTLIESLTIIFQSHNCSIVNFCEGVNVIIGSSDQGKTAIIRAIRWVVDNRPSGDSFIPHGHNFARVNIKTGDGIVSRTKGQSDNTYQINNGEKFKAFGLSVPDPVKNLLNISDINFQNQMDAPFLLSSSSGEVSRYLNNIVNLEKIDTSIANITRRLKNESKELTIKELGKSMLEEEAENFSWIPNAEDDLRKLSSMRRIAIDAWRRSREINHHIYTIKNLQNELDKVRRITAAKDEVERLELISNEIKEIKQKHRELKDLIINIKANEKSLINTRNRRKEMEKELEQMMPEICPLCGR